MGRCSAQENEFSHCLPHCALKNNRHDTEQTKAGGGFPTGSEDQAWNLPPAGYLPCAGLYRAAREGIVTEGERRRARAVAQVSAVAHRRDLSISWCLEHSWAAGCAGVACALHRPLCASWEKVKWGLQHVGFITQTQVSSRIKIAFNILFITHFKLLAEKKYKCRSGILHTQCGHCCCCGDGSQGAGEWTGCWGVNKLLL